MSLSPQQLLRKCENVMKSFNPRAVTVDSHCDTKLGKCEGPDAEPWRVFVKQVFYGCVRYKKPLKLFLSSFYYNNSGKTSRNDYTRYMILGYLALFRLDELGWNRFRTFILSDDPLKMMVLLEYLFNEDTLNSFLKPELCKTFDRDFVEDDIINRLLSQMDGASELMDALRVKAYGIAAAKAKADEEKAAAFKGKPATVPKPFNLTTPKPRLVPEPMAIPQGVKAKPVPHKMLNRTSLKQIEEEDAKRRARSHQTTNRKYEGIKREPKLHKTKNTIRELRERVEEERMAPCRVRFKAKPAPHFTTDAQVKLTAATILREDALYKKKQVKEAAVLKKYESELRDTSSFYAWQQEQRKKDEQAKLARVERLRAEMAASHKAAHDAMEFQLARNKVRAAEMRVVAEEVLRKREVEEKQIVKRKQRLAVEIRKVRDSAPQVAKKKIHEANQRKREAIKTEIADRIERKKKEDAVEQERRNDLIRRIRAIERVPKLRAKVFDPTTSSGQGLLEEMSLVELRERLRIVKARDAEEVVEKRKAIMRVKQEKEKKLKARLENIRRVRKMAYKDAREQRRRLKQREMEEKREEQDVADRAVKEVAKRLDAKRAARQKELDELAAEEEKIAKKRQFLGAAASMVEEKKFEELLLGADREARVMQSEAKAEQVVAEETDARTRRQRVTNARRRRRAKAEQDDIDRQNLLRRKKEIADREYAEGQEKKARVKTVRSWHRKHTDYLRTLNTYATDMNDTILEQARGNRGVDMEQTLKSRIDREQGTTLDRSVTRREKLRQMDGEPAVGFKSTMKRK